MNHNQNDIGKMPDEGDGVRVVAEGFFDQLLMEDIDEEKVSAQKQQVEYCEEHIKIEGEHHSIVLFEYMKTGENAKANASETDVDAEPGKA